MNKIETALKQGLKEFNELHTVSITLQSGMMLGNTTEEACIKSYERLEDHFKTHQKDLLDAVVAEVREIDLKKRVMHDHEYIVDKSNEEIITDTETLINNSTGV